jgi:hypothetical protein
VTDPVDGGAEQRNVKWMVAPSSSTRPAAIAVGVASIAPHRRRGSQVGDGRSRERSEGIEVAWQV